jgi:RNA polymerase sigma-70 factor (ECF subfamily)
VSGDARIIVRMSEDLPQDGAPAGPAEREAFDREVEAVAPALFTWAEVRLRGELRSQLDPQDLVQEVWCRAWRKRDSFDAASTSFRYWIFRIAKNVLLEGLRRMRDAGFAAGKPGSTTRLFALQELTDSATGVTRRVARDEGLKLFAEWLAGLDEEDQSLILHCGLEGMGRAEAAVRLQLGQEALAKRWQRLLRRLEEQKLPRQLLASMER